MKEVTSKDKIKISLDKLRGQYRQFYVESFLEAKDLISFFQVSEKVCEDKNKKFSGFNSLPEIKFFKTLKAQIKEFIVQHFRKNKYMGLKDFLLKDFYEVLLKNNNIDPTFNFDILDCKKLLQELHLYCFLKGSADEIKMTVSDANFKELLLDKIMALGDGDLFEYVPKNLKDDKVLVLKLLEKSCLVARFISDRLKDDADVAKIVLGNNSLGLSFLSENYRGNIEVAMDCMAKKPYCWHYLTEELRSSFLSKAIGLNKEQEIRFLRDGQDNNVGLVITNTNDDLHNSLNKFFRRSEFFKDDESWLEYCESVVEEEEELRIRFYAPSVSGDWQLKFVIPAILQSLDLKSVAPKNAFRTGCCEKLCDWESLFR
jgi:hypothetical protein